MISYYPIISIVLYYVVSSYIIVYHIIWYRIVSKQDRRVQWPADLRNAAASSIDAVLEGI